MDKPELSKNTITIDCLKRRIGFVDQTAQCIEVCFPPPRGACDTFLLCCSIAMAQSIVSGRHPTDWAGAEESFLAAVIKHFRWNLRMNSLSTYWVDFKHGRDATNHRTDILVDGKRPKDEGKLAEILFQRQKTFFMGPRQDVGNAKHLYWPIQFQNTTAEIDALRAFVEELFTPKAFRYANVRYLINNISEDLSYKVVFGDRLTVGRSSLDNDIDVPVTSGDSVSDLTISRLQSELYFEDRYFRLRCRGHNSDFIPASSQGTAEISPDKCVSLTDGLKIRIAGKIGLLYCEYFLRLKDYPPLLLDYDKKLLSTVSQHTLMDRSTIADVPICCSLHDEKTNIYYVFARHAVTFGKKSCCIDSGSSEASTLGAILVSIREQLLLFTSIDNYSEVALNHRYRIGDNTFVIEAI